MRLFNLQSSVCNLRSAIARSQPAGFDGRAPARTFHSRRGVILVLVLVVIAVLSLAALTFSELMFIEHKAAYVSTEQVQARCLAESGVEMTRLFLAGSEEARYEAGGCYDNPDQFRGVLVIDEGTARGAGRFTFVAPTADGGSYGGVRYGLENESAKLNLNMLLEAEKQADQSADQSEVENAGRQMLMGLPGMTEDIADAILDWIDPDDDPRDYGAEIEYYGSMLDFAYAPKNGYLESLDELLLVRGVTPSLLFGVDANRNGSADAGESDSLALPDVDNSDGSMDRGWAAYLTLWSLETNQTPDGEAKIDLNQSDMEQLYTQLEEVLEVEAAEFIVAYRQFGPYNEEEAEESPEGQPEGAGGLEGLDQAGPSSGAGPTQPSGGGGGRSDSEGGQSDAPAGGRPSGGSGGGYQGSTPAAPSAGYGGMTSSDAEDTSDAEQESQEPVLSPNGLDLSKSGGTRIENVLDLIGARVRATLDGESEPTILGPEFPDESDAMSEYLPVLMDYTTTDSRKILPGRININQAPKAVLSGIPGMTTDLLERILVTRELDPAPGSGQRHATWLLTEGLVTKDEMKKMMPFVTGGGSVFRGQAVGYFDRGGPTARIEVIFNATESPVQVISWRDLSHLGRGYTEEILGTEGTE